MLKLGTGARGLKCLQFLLLASSILPNCPELDADLERKQESDFQTVLQLTFSGNFGKYPIVGRKMFKSGVRNSLVGNPLF